MALKFGTDGWRALIAEEYTFDNVRAVSAALASYLRETEPERVQNGVAIGYDTRFLSREFAQATAQTLAKHGIPVRISERDAPTPATAWETRSNKRASGVMITASHNPPAWNGFKFFTSGGGPADKDATNRVEALLQNGSQNTSNGAPASIEEYDPRPGFFSQLRSVIDFDLLKQKPGRAVCDFVHGNGRGYVDALLGECGWEVSNIRDTPDPMFGGILPDPANPKCHDALQAEVQSKNAKIGLANDPDADRFGVVDELGEYITPNQVLCLVYLHLLEHRGMRGPVARTVATTGLLDAIARAHGQETIETAVGFKWLGAAIEEQGAILGGEESGGLSIAGHLPGKDGVLADLLMAEIYALHQKPLSVLYNDILQKYGEFFSTRVDLHLDAEKKDALMNRMKTDAPKEIAGSKVVQVVTLDGVKLKLEDDSWLLMRPSGTEPLVRVYTEAKGQKRLDEIAAAAKSLT